MTAPTLTVFLLACIADDEAEAQANREHNEGCWPNMDDCQSHYGEDGQWSWGPARVLAECEAKRRIVERLAPLLDPFSWASDQACRDEISLAGDALELLALPYSSRPDYDEAWRP